MIQCCITNAADSGLVIPGHEPGPEESYKRDATLGLWLPSKMSEQYEGAITFPNRPPFHGLSTTRATYSDFKQFGTGTQVKTPKAPAPVSP